jgi:ATP phosphoribosyltransferase
LGEKITPGNTSPTVMPLENKDWLAVKSLIAKEHSIELMEALEKIGARDILIYDLQNCRI